MPNQLKGLLQEFVHGLKALTTVDDKLKFLTEFSCKLTENKYPQLDLLLEIMTLRLKNNYTSAMEMTLSSMKRYKDFQYYYNELGHILIKLNQFDEAIGVFNKAIELDDHYISPFNAKGYIYLQRHQFEEAIMFLNQAVEIDKDFAQPHYNLGIIFHHSGKYDMAIDAYTRAIEINKSFAQPWKGMGDTYVKQLNYNKAIDAYKTAIYLNKNYENAYKHLGEIYDILGRYPKAIVEYKHAFEISSNKEYLLLISQLYKKLSNLSESKKYLDQYNKN